MMEGLRVKMGFERLFVVDPVGRRVDGLLFSRRRNMSWRYKIILKGILMPLLRGQMGVNNGNSRGYMVTLRVLNIINLGHYSII
jgi:hypothetical protein